MKGASSWNRLTVCLSHLVYKENSRDFDNPEEKRMLMITIVAAVLIAAVLVFAATRPDTFRIQRRTSVKAPPEKVFALINDFRNWDSWSPWEKIGSRDEKNPQRRDHGQGRSI